LNAERTSGEADRRATSLCMNSRAAEDCTAGPESGDSERGGFGLMDG